MSGVSTQSSWRSFRVVRRETLSKGVTGFTLYPTDAGPVAPYLPGQGVSVRATVPEAGFLTSHPFALTHASSPEDNTLTFAVEKMRSEVIKKSGELNVSNKNLWEDAVGMVPYTDDMDVKGMEAKAKEFYEAKLKSYFGEGASPYGGGGGVPPQDDKALDEFFRMKSLEGKFPKKE